MSSSFELIRPSLRCVLTTWSLLCIAGCERDASSAAQTLQARPTAVTIATPTESTQQPLVVFLGDSIAAGFELPADEAFPAELARELAARGRPFRLSNASVSGDTSAGGRRRLAWVLKQRPAVVVIELGANDGLRGLPVAALEENLRAIVEGVRAHGARPLLLGMRIPPSYGAEYADALAAVYPRVAQALDVPLVPSFMAGVAGVASLNLSDGIHPTREGHRRLAAAVLPALERLIPTTP